MCYLFIYLSIIVVCTILAPCHYSGLYKGLISIMFKCCSLIKLFCVGNVSSSVVPPHPLTPFPPFQHAPRFNMLLCTSSQILHVALTTLQTIFLSLSLSLCFLTSWQRVFTFPGVPKASIWIVLDTIPLGNWGDYIQGGTGNTRGDRITG